MSRPCRCRRVHHQPDAHYFKPRGIPVDMLDEVQLTMDELDVLSTGTPLDWLFEDRIKVKAYLKDGE